ncbi:MAG: cob(I)yrinic acid a,c-diamide adenosyltransferase [Phycisphaerales bacterium]
MVRLTKIYTKTGDDGTTGLADGQRVRKDDLRVEAYGCVDEANSTIGLAVLACEDSVSKSIPLKAGIASAGAAQDQTLREIAMLLSSIQHDLFDLGADLATPRKSDEQPGTRLRIVVDQVTRLEQAIDKYNDELAPLNSFVLPGGTPAAAALHLARTTTRRAERVAVALHAERQSEINPEAVKYLNRLSDLLFVLSRVANNWGKGDILWKPGTNR